MCLKTGSMAIQEVMQLMKLRILLFIGFVFGEAKEKHSC
jgi:hypothetical protein